MRPYLNDYIHTLTRRRQERVTNLLEEARVGKEQLDTLAARLAEEFGEFTPVLFAGVQAESVISAEKMRMDSREMTLRIADLFAMSNLISLLLESHSSVLATDVKTIEDELIVMQKMAENYAFLLADNQSFDFAHLEPFTDGSNRDSMTTVPDRGVAPFGPAEFATVRGDEGVLTLADLAAPRHGLTARVVDGNAKAFTISDTGIENALTPGSATGWKVTVAAAGPVTAPLTSVSAAGVQFLVEFSLTSPAPASVLKLVPFSEMASELLQVTLYETAEGGQGYDLLAEPERFDRPFSLRFPTRKVARFRVLLNQPTYERSARTENSNELRYVDLIRRTRERIVDARNRLNQSIQRRDALFTHFLNTLPFPRTILRPNVSPSSREWMERLQSSAWRRQEQQWADILMEVLKNTEALKGLEGELFRLEREEETADRIPNPYNPTNVQVGGFQYYYTLGLHFVSIGMSSPGAKGVFVSKPMVSSGSVGEVRLKTSEKNFELPATSGRESPWITSVEYSVSNKSEPVNESDWIPILPVGQTNIIAERLLPNSMGVAMLRFPANPTDSIYVYRNGFIVNTKDTDFLRDQTTQSIIGLDIPSDVFNANDVFTIDYHPVNPESQMTINFESHGFGDVRLIGASDSTGAGEYFRSTGPRNTVELSHHPYVDDGLKTSSTYEPITVRLDGGVVAENLTAYTGTDTPFPPSGYYYKHSGNTLMFNQPIAEPFRVYYQYLENSVRVRVVLRANSSQLASPKVDYFHLKARTSQVE